MVVQLSLAVVMVDCLSLTCGHGNANITQEFTTLENLSLKRFSASNRLQAREAISSGHTTGPGSLGISRWSNLVLVGGQSCTSVPMSAVLMFCHPYTTHHLVYFAICN